MVDLHDTLILDNKARRLSTGELAASVRCARTGTQDYAGHEVGKPELQRVTVYRPEAEVMKRDSFASFAGVPVTIEHPKESVTTDNWKQYAVGEAGDEVVRDGEFVRVPILVRDEAAIRAIQDGKRQISMGYSCSLEFVDGVAPDGTAYQAVQRDIKINHLAVVDRARGGDALVVEDQRTYSADGDGVISDPATNSNSNDGVPQMATKTILVDGLQVEVTDAAEAAITKLQGQIRDAAAAKDAADTALATAKTELAAKDTEIATLKQAVEDAKVTPAQLRDAAKVYAGVCDKAKALNVTFAEDADADAIMRAVVDSKMGESAKDWTDAQVAASFAVLTKDAKVADPLRDAIKDGVRTQTNDAAVNDAYSAMVSDLENAWKPKAA
jgi:hypothetical protein